MTLNDIEATTATAMDLVGDLQDWTLTPRHNAVALQAAEALVTCLLTQAELVESSGDNQAHA